MRQRIKKDIIYVCSAINENKLISHSIIAMSQKEASDIFYQKYQTLATEILGPFHEAKKQIFKNFKILKFSNTKPRKAIYNNWIVNAFILSEPVNCAYLLYVDKINDENIPFPTGTVVVPIDDLRFKNNA